MQIKQLDRPTVGNRTGLGQAYDKLMGEVDMPINNWCREQQPKNKKIKL